MAAHDGASSSGSSFAYDVFLSFRSEDTRNNFTGFLHSALKREGINAFIDSEDLWGGENIQTALLDAIQQSKISIPVFSKGYADSKWCLMELVEIIRCHRSNDQKVLPIFLDVEPRDVRYQTGSFEGSFQKHMERYDAQKIQSWKDALIEISAKKGYELKQVNGNQSELVKLIVDWALSELSINRLSDVKNPVGLDAPVEDLFSRLKVDSNDVRFVGICGLGGIGKTTIATTLYNRIFKNFGMSCFLANVREEASSGRKGVVSLQEKLIYSVSKKEEKICIVQGKQLIKEKLQGKKVLLILDDVDSNSQLEDLAIDSILFGPGSRIIITTRDEHILNVAKVDRDNIYRPKELDDKKSLQLFSLHAFSSDQPPEEYLQLSRDVTHLAGGLPLTLEVLGSTFCDKDNREEKVWKSMLQELETIPHSEVYKKLKISYDNLEDHEKSIFLDVACLFVGWNKEILIPIWDACGFNPISAIKKLTQRSLLKVITWNHGTCNMLRMHDQIQAMGRRIVCEESPTEPSKRSRIWSREEILEATEEPGAGQMLEVVYAWNAIPQPLLQMRNLAMMSKLRVVSIGVACSRSEGRFLHLPPNLRWLTWEGLTLAASFYHKKLVHMDLSMSQIREAWTNKPQNENERFQKLKVLNLWGCDVSHEPLDFSWFPYLEILDLTRCSNMVNLHNSIGDLKSLVELKLRETEIEELPNSICSLSSLKVLDLHRCRSLKNLPESIGDLKSLVNLNLGYTKIEELPNSICSLSSLEVLTLQSCSSLKNLPESIWDLKALVKLDLEETKIEEIPSNIYKLSCLKVLILKVCSSLKTLPESIGDLKSLVELDLERTKIEEIPSSIYKLSCLEVLILKGCSLKNLPNSIGDLKSLVKLDLSDTKINDVPDGVWLLEKLEELILRNCDNLVKLPISWGRMRCLHTIDLVGTRILLPQDDYPSVILVPSLVGLRIGNNLESSLPPWISGLPQLRHLCLMGYTKLESIPDLPSTLTTLDVTDCISLLTLPDLSSLKHLTKLRLIGCKELKEIRGIEGTESLEELSVTNCKTLTNTPKWKIHGQGTLLVDESQRIDNYSFLNVNDVIDKGLILCLVFDLRDFQDHVEEGELVDISLSIFVNIRNHQKHSRVRCWLNEVVIEGVEYTCNQDKIYLHHFKGFDWFGIPLQPGFDAIENIHVIGLIKQQITNREEKSTFTTSKGLTALAFLYDEEQRPILCKLKYWKVLLESTASEQQQQITNQEEESITTTARRMVADFFNWSGDEEVHMVSDPSSLDGESSYHNFESSYDDGEGSNPVVPQQADEGGGQAGRVAEDPNLSEQALGLSPERLSRAAKRRHLDMDDAGPSRAD